MDFDDMVTAVRAIAEREFEKLKKPLIRQMTAAKTSHPESDFSLFQGWMEDYAKDRLLAATLNAERVDMRIFKEDAKAQMDGLKKDFGRYVHGTREQWTRLVNDIDSAIDKKLEPYITKGRDVPARR